MRSRYTAFVLGHAEHLYRTTHPDNPAVNGVARERYLHETVDYCQEVEFVKLTIQGTWEPDEDGTAMVEFTAEWIVDGGAGAFTERSNFVPVDGRWLYHSGREV